MTNHFLVAIIFVQLFAFTLSQATHTQDGSNVAGEHGLSSTIPPDDEYDVDMEGDEYDDADGFPELSSTVPTSAEHFEAEMNDNNTTLNQHEGVEYHDLDEDEDDDHIFADTMSVNRPESKRPAPPVVSSTFRSFPRPTMLVGIVGGVTLGILSVLVLLMFVIYRMRKRDEGSYVLDEGARKSPSHTYTRVSSREFFA